jgi:5-methylcytosine-specific restriction endonuclease McrA
MEAKKKAHKKYKQKIKLEVIKEYGGKCICCGEKSFEFLTIDHINKNGAEEKRKLKISGANQMYAWLKRNNYPKDNYQLLCYNCNSASFIYGECPHKKILDI